MPELPEVETTRLGLTPHIAGRRVTGVVVRNGDMRWPVPTDLAQRLVGEELLSLSRRGKYLLFEFSSGVVLWHLGMSGSLRIVKPGEPEGAHDHIDVVFDGVVLRFHDPRRFGSVLWTENPYQHKLIKHLGPEPLSLGFTGEYLYLKSRGRSQAIKTFIMDSKVVVGVGNIYANEALFSSGLHPLKAANRLTKPKAALLVLKIKSILEKAIARGGTTLRDFVNSEGKPGYFAQELSVYGRGGLDCKACGKRLTEKKVGQRSTVFCTHCQR